MFITQLNYSFSNTSSSIINKQLRAILIQNFKIKYIPSKKNIVINTLFYYLKLNKQIALEKIKEDFKDFIKY